MADTYGGTKLTEKEKAQVKSGRHQRGLEGGMTGLSAGSSIGGTIGAAVGSIIPGAGTLVGGAVGSAIGAGVGFLVGSIAGNVTYDDDSQRAQIQAEKQAARAREDEQNALRAAQSLAKKGPDVSVRNLPGAPSDENILMGSMPVRMGGSAPMDPYRQTVRNKFGWS
tara:strand:- start:1593 stop:2093 length:501 start_codon:yes stop_codon:yes gene_type:complete